MDTNMAARKTSGSHTRQYRMGARAEAAEQTRQRILVAARDLFLSAPYYDDVTLEQIAARADVALKTVLRRFRSKDELLVASAQTEAEERSVPAGDVEAVVRVLSARYEQNMDLVLRYLPMEARVAPIAHVLAQARQGHWDWLEQAFAPQLSGSRGALRRRRVGELFVATEIYAWHALRRRFGLSQRAAEQVLRETLEALVACWSTRANTEDGE
jgi:AcrR family transcriptional regulator